MAQPAFADFHPGTETAHMADTRGATMRVHAVDVEVLTGPSAGARVRVDRPVFVIGSGERADLRIADETVSREHLRIVLGSGSVTLRDDGSTNGSWIGGLRVKELGVHASTQVVIGSTTLGIRIDTSGAEIPISASARFGDAIGVSPAMRHLFSTLERVAASDITVLVEGESGTGKEVLAQAIHATSNRAEGPFVAIDCGAIPANLIESELFGHERGAFTGADRARQGAFEQADGGTLFLDELGELPLELQAKLLRALETREIRPLGAQRTKRVDVRIVAATNRNLVEASRSGAFRRDLYYRLAVVRVNVPPLRDRREDILPLATAFLRRVPGRERAEIPADLAAMLSSYSWPGNVRELRNVVERYVVLGANDEALFGDEVSGERPIAGSMNVQDLSHLPYHEARSIALERFERDYFPGVLARANNVVTRAAQLAQVGRGSFHRMLNRQRGGG